MTTVSRLFLEECLLCSDLLLHILSLDAQNERFCQQACNVRDTWI